MHQENKKKKQVAFIVPFWSNNAFIGNKRISDFLDWMSRNEYYCYIFTLGKVNRVIAKNDYEIVETKNTLLNISDYVYERSKKSVFFRWLNLIIRNFLEIILIPDKNILFGYSLNINYAKNTIPKCDLIISSSPVESSHLIAYNYSKKFGIKHIADFRDGWTDEPLNIYSKIFKHRKIIELKQEFKVVNNAKLVIVNSPGWSDYLIEKYPDIKPKLFTITNSYQNNIQPTSTMKISSSSIIRLVYAGKFSESSYLRRPKFLFGKFYELLKNIENRTRIRIDIYGDLTKRDINEIVYWRNLLNGFNCEIYMNKFLKTEDLSNELMNNDGLLMLSASRAAIPSKLYDYIVTQKPILCFAPINNPFHLYLQDLPQLFLFNLERDYSSEDNVKFKEFLILCKDQTFKGNIPNVFSKEVNKKKFLELIRNIN